MPTTPSGTGTRLASGADLPQCSPDILVRTVEPAQLRALGVTAKGGHIDANAIYRVNDNSQVCNFLDVENCPDGECPCKRLKKGQYAFIREFWSDYNRNVKHAF